jgi:hypothetical protein
VPAIAFRPVRAVAYRSIESSKPRASISRDARQEPQRAALFSGIGGLAVVDWGQARQLTLTFVEADASAVATASVRHIRHWKRALAASCIGTPATDVRGGRSRRRAGPAEVCAAPEGLMNVASQSFRENGAASRCGRPLQREMMALTESASTSTVFQSGDGASTAGETPTT